MTPLHKPIHRLTTGELDGSYGPDRGRKLVASFAPGDVLLIRPHGTRRTETVSLFDVYRFAIRCRVNLGVLTKARERKAKKAVQRESRSIQRAEKRLFESKTNAGPPAQLENDYEND